MRDVQQESVLATSTFEAVARWNRWRRENPETKPSLEGAHLLNAVLQEVDLSHADLRNAFLRGAHLYAADLSHADLRGAILVGANLNRANLRHANLEDATLASATLNEGTDIEGANFHRCT